MTCPTHSIAQILHEFIQLKTCDKYFFFGTIFEYDSKNYQNEILLSFD